MTTRYAQGRATEYQAIKELKKQGYYCQRAAQSKGIDIVAITQRTLTADEHVARTNDALKYGIEPANVRCIMVTRSQQKSKFNLDYSFLMRLNLTNQVSKEVWTKLKRGWAKAQIPTP